MNNVIDLGKPHIRRGAITVGIDPAVKPFELAIALASGGYQLTWDTRDGRLMIKPAATPKQGKETQ